jgi:hypothetical protein
MKTTIILILALACQVMNGQISKEMEAWFDSWFDSASYHIEGYEELGDFTNKEYIELKATKLLVTAWDEYSKECYADSVVYWHRHNHTIMEWPETIPCVKGDTAWWSTAPCECDVTHTERTFPNFILFLKRKYGIQ